MAHQPGTHTIRMPKWGLSMQEGTLTRWYVSEGDRVRVGAPFCEIETTKISNDYEAPFDGVVARLLAAPDEVVPIGRPIAILADDGAAEAAIEAAVAAATWHGDGEQEGAAAAPALRTVEADGVALAFREAGPPDAEPALVFLHGFGGDHGNWSLVQERVAGAGHRTLAFDLPGHGASGKSVRDGSAAALAGIVRAGLAELGLGPVALVAHSFGALVAAELARAGDPAIEAVVLLAPVGLGPAPDPSFVRGFLAAARKRDMKAVLERLFADPGLLGRGIVNDALEALRDEEARQALTRIGTALLALDSAALGATRDLLGPAWHVLWGERDAIVPLPAPLREALGQRCQVIPDVGHMPHVEAPALVADAILKHLAAPRHVSA